MIQRVTLFDHPPPYGGGNTQAADWDRTIRVGGNTKLKEVELI